MITYYIVESFLQFHLRKGSSLGLISAPSGDKSVVVLKLDVSEGLLTTGLYGGFIFFVQRVSKLMEFRNLWFLMSFTPALRDNYHSLGCHNAYLSH